MQLDAVPDGAQLDVTWRAYDGLRHHEFTGQSDGSAGDALLGEAVDVLLQLGVDVDGPIALRPIVEITSVEGRKLGSSKLPPLRIDLSSGVLVVLKPEPTVVDDMAAELFPERLRGLRASRVAVASRRLDAPLPVVELDNSDKEFDQTGLPAVRLNMDLEREPMTKEVFAQLLERAARLDDLEVLWQAMQVRQDERAADIEVAKREGGVQ